MDPDVKKKIDAALGKVKEPQSNLPIVDLGLVGNVRYSDTEKSIVITLAIGAVPYQCPACSAINGVVKEGIARRVREEFSKEFPDFSIVAE
jgi:metal-sulfur cluster biosynthetic enzyme